MILYAESLFEIVGPAFSNFILDQNQKISTGAIQAYRINLDTLLMINACIDRQTAWPAYPTMATNNTYDLVFINDTIHQSMLDSLNLPGACNTQLDNCHSLAGILDPGNLGVSPQVNEVCQNAESFCAGYIRDAYSDNTLRNSFDFTQLEPDPFPYPFLQGWLNRAHVQAALGVARNFSSGSTAIAQAFRNVGDYPRSRGLQAMGRLLDNGVKVHLAYGDRDFSCNWMGGELISRAVNYSQQDRFRGAGYANMQTNASYVGGLVRQAGNFSFTRVFEAGHMMPAYQPETARAIFERAVFNRDVATGEVDLLATGDYATTGPADTLATKNAAPPAQLGICYLLDAEDTCTPDQLASVVNGTGRVVDCEWDCFFGPFFSLFLLFSTDIYPYVLGMLQDANSMALFPQVFEGLPPLGTPVSAGGIHSSFVYWLWSLVLPAVVSLLFISW